MVNATPIAVEEIGLVLCPKPRSAHAGESAAPTARLAMDTAQRQRMEPMTDNEWAQRSVTLLINRLIRLLVANIRL